MSSSKFARPVEFIDNWDNCGTNSVYFLNGLSLGQIILGRATTYLAEMYNQMQNTKTISILVFVQTISLTWTNLFPEGFI